MTLSKGRLLRVAATVVIVAALVLFARTVNWSETWVALKGTDPMLMILAAAVNFASLLLKGVRWWIFLRPVGASSLGLALRATIVGAGLNNILVANGGQAASVLFVSRATGIPGAKILATFALERMFEILGYVILLVAAVSFFALPDAVAKTRPVAWVALVAMGVFMAYLIRRPSSALSQMDDHAHEAIGGWRRAVRRFLARFASTLGGISTAPRFLAALAVSIAAWGLQVWTYALTARAAGFHLPIVGTVAAILAVNLGFVVRATPGNVGVFQMAYALMAAAFGMDKDHAIAVGLLIQTQQILPVTVLGVVLAPQLLSRSARAEARLD
jgi:uncharacterized protein (TIRG00374 family)